MRIRIAAMVGLLALSVSSGCLLFASEVECSEDNRCAADDVCVDGLCVAESEFFADAGRPDSGTPDAGGDVDAGPHVDGGLDAGLGPDGGLDAGTLDAGGLDAGGLDAGGLDAGGLDAGNVDAGALSDAGCVELYPNPASWEVLAMTPAVSKVGTPVTFHGRFPRCGATASIRRANDGDDLFSAPSENGRTVTFDTRNGTASVTGEASMQFSVDESGAIPVGSVRLNIRNHGFQLGRFVPELPQTTEAKQLGVPANGAPTVGTDVFLTPAGKFCGAGGDGNGDLVCLQTDADGAVRQPKRSARLFEAPISGASVVIAGHRVYGVGGGAPALDTTVHRDVDTNIANASTIGSDLTVPRRDAATVVVGDKICAVGGQNTAYLATVECATIREDGTTGPFIEVGSLNTGRSKAQAAVVGDFLVVAGGEVLVTVPQASVTIEVASIVGGVIGPFVSYDSPAQAAAAAVVLDNSMFVIGGGIFPPADALQISLSPTGVPTIVGHEDLLEKNLENARTAVVGNFVYLSPGLADAVTRPAVASFIPDTATFAPDIGQGLSLTPERSFFSSAVIGDEWFLFGGRRTQTYLLSIAKVTINKEGKASSYVDSVGTLPESRSHSCAVVIENSVFVVGGETDGGAKPTSIIRVNFNPLTGLIQNSFLIPNALVTGRQGPRCHILKDHLYVVGGKPLAADATTEGVVQSVSISALITADNANVDPVFTSTIVSTQNRWMASSVVAGPTEIVTAGGILFPPNSVGNYVVTIGETSPGVMESGAFFIDDDGVSPSASAMRTATSLVVIGGGYNSLDTVDFARQWNLDNIDIHTVHSGFLATARRGHGSVVIGPEILSAGGRSDEPNNAPQLDIAVTTIGD